MSIPDYEELSPWKKFQAEVHYDNLKQEHSGSVATTNPSDLSTLDDISIQTLIDHYLRVREKLPDNLRVRDRLVELQQELLNRQTTDK